MTLCYPAWIVERSFGGLGTAVSPNSALRQGNWPNGPSSPMSYEACSALVAACNGGAGADDPRCMVFLVGGAGNGKSKLAADTVRAIEGAFIGEARAFAQRTYHYCLEAGGRLCVINDATIPPQDQHDTPLLRDLNEALAAGDHLLACINRGVLIGETGNLGSSGHNPSACTASEIVRWLLSGENPAFDSKEVSVRLIDENITPSHYSVAQVCVGAIPRATLHVVYMDRASLLEDWPSAAPEPGDYRNTLSFGAIDVIPILARNQHSSAAAFEGCLRSAAETYAATVSCHPLDPIRANALTLSKPRGARGWCALLRGAEIVAGTHFTYRELWALFAHSVVGPITGEGLQKLADWVGKRLIEVEESTGDVRLSALLGLGTLRAHMLLFDAGRWSPDLSDYVGEYSWPSTTSEALKSAHLADPLRHFGPDDGHDMAQLAERLSSIEEGQLPGSRLSKEDEDVAACWTRLDAEIEKSIRDEIDPQNDMSSLRKRNSILAWYGRYMYRLVGLARGWPAHCTIVNKWQNAWINAKKNQRLPAQLQEAILDIVAPSSGRGNETFFTFLQPRVDAGEEAADRAMVALPRGQFEIAARTEGDRIELEISHTGRGDGPPAAVAALDFHLLREASARSNGHGFTDSLTLIEPRVERIRASIVAHQLSLPANRHRFKFTYRGSQFVTN